MKNSEQSTPAHIPQSHLHVVEKAQYAILSTVRASDGELSANPVGYCYDDGVFRISTLKSRVKYRNLVADPRAALSLVDPDDHTVYIEVRGHVSIEEDPDRAYANEQFRRNSGGQEPPADLDAPDAERVILVLVPRQVSTPLLYGGRFSKS